MELNPAKTSFGRNETFNLRYSWLNKGLKEFKQNKNTENKLHMIFFSEETFFEIPESFGVFVPLILTFGAPPSLGFLTFSNRPDIYFSSWALDL